MFIIVLNKERAYYGHNFKHIPDKYVEYVIMNNNSPFIIFIGKNDILVKCNWYIYKLLLAPIEFNINIDSQLTRITIYSGIVDRDCECETTELCKDCVVKLTIEAGLLYIGDVIRVLHKIQSLKFHASDDIDSFVENCSTFSRMNAKISIMYIASINFIDVSIAGWESLTKDTHQSKTERVRLSQGSISDIDKCISIYNSLITE